MVRAKKQAVANIANPGAALGQAVGEQMEEALARFLGGIAQERGCSYIAKNPRGGQLTLQDRAGTKYRIDAIVADSQNRPLVVLESKYIRYIKHNRDKGSWICATHRAIRRHYPTIRKSVAVLAGGWSETSLEMIRSQDIDIFLIPFSRIVFLLKDYGIKFDWAEKDRHRPSQAMMNYRDLPDDKKRQIGEAMLDTVRAPLGKAVAAALAKREAKKIARAVVELHSDLGEIREYRFNNPEDAVTFLNQADAKAIFNSDSAPTLPN